MLSLLRVSAIRQEHDLSPAKPVHVRLATKNLRELLEREQVRIEFAEQARQELGLVEAEFGTGTLARTGGDGLAGGGGLATTSASGLPAAESASDAMRSAAPVIAGAPSHMVRYEAMGCCR